MQKLNQIKIIENSPFDDLNSIDARREEGRCLLCVPNRGKVGLKPHSGKIKIDCKQGVKSLKTSLQAKNENYMIWLMAEEKQEEKEKETNREQWG